MAAIKTKISSNALVYTVLVLATLALAVWLYTKLDYKIVEKDQGYQGEARTNPYLAAEFFLRRMGQKSEKIKLFTDKQKVLDQHDTLLVPSVRLAFDSRRSNDMLEWANRGGHLIITGQPDSETNTSQRDHLLDSLGLYIERQSLGDDSELDEEPVNIAIYDEDHFWQVDFDDYLVISHTAEFKSEVIWSVEDNARVHAMQIKSGQGLITLLSDIRMFRNDYIESYDHAAFLLSLANDQSEATSNNVFYYSLFEDSMSLYQWLWENAKPLMLSFCVFIIIVLWMLIPRFGPLINVHKPIRRQFLEHLTASGNYHWRQGHYHRLLLEVRKQLSKKVKLKHPEWTALSKHDQIMHFVELSEIEEEAIDNALFDNSVEQVNDFTNKVKILEKLRKSL